MMIGKFGRRCALGVVIGLAITLASCGDDDDGGSGDDGGGDGGSPLTEMLSVIPVTPEAAAYLSFVDYERYREIIEVELPPDDASPTEVDEWAVDAFGATREQLPGLAFSSFFATLYTQNGALRTELGFDVSEVDQALETGEAPGIYNVFRGRFESGDIDSAVRTEPVFSELLEDVTYNELTYQSWGNDFEQDLNRVTAVRPLGVGGRLAAADDELLWCAWTEGMEGMIDARSGAIQSLAGREDFGSIGAALDEIRPYSAYLSARPQVLEVAGEEGIEPKLAPYLAFATGAARDDVGSYLAIVVAHADAETAVENATNLRERIDAGRVANAPWAEGVQSVETRSEGVLTIATLRGASLPYDLVVRADPVLLQEP